MYMYIFIFICRTLVQCRSNIMEVKRNEIKSRVKERNGKIRESRIRYLKKQYEKIGEQKLGREEENKVEAKKKTRVNVWDRMRVMSDVPASLLSLSLSVLRCMSTTWMSSQCTSCWYTARVKVKVLVSPILALILLASVLYCIVYHYTASLPASLSLTKTARTSNVTGVFTPTLKVKTDRLTLTAFLRHLLFLTVKNQVRPTNKPSLSGIIIILIHVKCVCETGCHVCEVSFPISDISCFLFSSSDSYITARSSTFVDWGKINHEPVEIIYRWVW